MSECLPPELPALVIGLGSDGRWHLEACLEGGKWLSFHHTFATQAEALAAAHQKVEGCRVSTGVTLSIFEGEL